MIDQKIMNKILNAPANTYIIFFVYECPYCQKALKLLREKNVSYKGYDINKINGGLNKLLQVLIANSDLLKFNIEHKTKPIIFYNKKFIGGFSELDKILL